MSKVLSKEEIEEIQKVTKKLRAHIVKMIHNDLELIYWIQLFQYLKMK